VTGRAVDIECHKVGVGEIWSRLTESNQKLGWLRPDFDRFAFDESDRSDNDEEVDFYYLIMLVISLSCDVLRNLYKNINITIHSLLIRHNHVDFCVLKLCLIHYKQTKLYLTCQI